MDYTAIDTKFRNPPLILTVVQLTLNSTPELDSEATALKAKFTEIGFSIPDQQKSNKINFTVRNGSVAPSQSESVYWTFKTQNNRNCISTSKDFITIYITEYTGNDDLLSLMDSICSAVSIVCNSKPYIKTISLRYVNGIKTTDSEFPLNHEFSGLPSGTIDTAHSHHNYNFWCETEPESHLTFNSSTVHGHQMLPGEVKQLGLDVDSKFHLSSEVDAVKLDCYETRTFKTPMLLEFGQLSEELARMRFNLKTIFLRSTTPTVKSSWEPYE